MKAQVDQHELLSSTHTGDVVWIEFRTAIIKGKNENAVCVLRFDARSSIVDPVVGR